MMNAPAEYEIEEEIGRTDRAIVYRARDNTHGDPVALKLVQNDHVGKREVEMLKRIQHVNSPGPAHVMRMLNAHEDNRDLWIVLELFSGTLEHLDPACMTPLAFMSIAVDSAKGLVEMERAGVVDDDVKPTNIAFKANSGRAAHLDLGCAHLAGERPVGYTPDFVAPEVEHGVSSPTSPCYGWARSMEYLVTGKSGFGPGDRLDSYVSWMGRETACLIADCCWDDYQRRPSVNEVYRRMKQIVHNRRRCPRCDAVMFHDGMCPKC
jgi:serine/threonine protein kinase